mgnify:FL=1
MKLYLVQHGEACSRDIDPERPLTDQGRADTDRLVGFLGQAGIRVQRVIHSGKLRAAQTAQQLAVVLAPAVEPERSSMLDPNDDPGAFDLETDQDRDTLVVGHLPFMSKLVSLLVTEDESRLVTAYQPGSIVCLEHDNGTRWHINWMVRPELLR